MMNKRTKSSWIISAGRVPLALSFWLLQNFTVRADPPILGAPAFSNLHGAALLSLTNCSDTNFQYVIQISTNLQDWTSYSTNFATDPSNSIAVAARYPSAFYRVQVIPHIATPMFQFAVVTRSNFNANGQNCRIDSFDSADPLYSLIGQYDPIKPKANGSIATDSSIVSGTNIGNINVYGHAYTGPGQPLPQIGPNGAIGNAAWNASSTGIQPGAWSGNFNANYPDVPTPTFAGAAVPAAVSNVITLNGGYYTAATDPGASSYYVTGPTVLWVQDSFKPGGVTLAYSNNPSLTVFVGRATGSGDTLDLSGNTVINQPGYAQNMQFYGLATCTSVKFSGTAGFVGCIYAPHADVIGGGGGNNTLDTSGAIIVNSITQNGLWKFHYDEHLTNSGPSL